MNNILVVSNFNAGRKKALKYRKTVQKFLLKNAKSFKFVSVDEIEPQLFLLFDSVIVMGGDGTVNKILPYIIHTDKTIGIIPCGTANLLAAALGIDSIKKALDILKDENITKVDVLEVNKKLSILRCGFGFDADIIGKTPQSLKNKFGYFAYFVAGIIFALRLKCKEYVITIDNNTRVVNASCVIIANAGNMYRKSFSIAKNAELYDGLFDVFLLKTQNPILFFIVILEIFLNIKINNFMTEYIKAKNVDILNKYSLAHIDGEKTKFTENITFSIIYKGINIYSKEHVCLERIETSIEDTQKITV